MLAREGVEVLVDDLLVVADQRCFAGPRCIDVRPEAADALAIEPDAPLVRTSERRRLRLPPCSGEYGMRGFLHLPWGADVRLERLLPVQRLPLLLEHRRVIGLGADFEHMLDLVALPVLRLIRPPVSPGVVASRRELRRRSGTVALQLRRPSNDPRMLKEATLSAPQPGPLRGVHSLEIVTGMPFGSCPIAVSTDPVPLPREALASLLRPALANPPCVIAFSGGRDSSALLAVAVDLARREGWPLPIPVTLCFSGAATEETGWQEMVLRHLRLDDWVRMQIGEELDLLGPLATVGCVVTVCCIRPTLT